MFSAVKGQINDNLDCGGSVFVEKYWKIIYKSESVCRVTWIRHRDNHVLTAGLYSYSKDNRFGIIRKEGSDDWILHIRFTQKRDEGRYECQIATKGGGYGHVVNLFVVVPEAIISGAPELHVQSGSTINLVCLVKDSITPPNFLFWFHNSEMINYDQSRGGISVLTDLENKEPTSKLSITDATFNDSGNYTCVSSNTKPASINIF
ncbi:Neural cell adhesion molecule 2 [Armadillidium nasatum]|uniref:Neural cell adhesion molecule 2 n=1 Tax=Armadillidium nasatum TaxID=96803 RepID=A0A5N5T182_9CRUS|nr:Neural cell adhesion molecule 2 [Armadillidium nasatum]